MKQFYRIDKVGAFARDMVLVNRDHVVALEVGSGGHGRLVLCVPFKEGKDLSVPPSELAGVKAWLEGE